MNKLYYIYDPMCSWCWGFKKTFEALKNKLDPSIEVVNVVGGLAPDNDAPMDDATKTMLQNIWRRVEESTGASFNHTFWTMTQPRRSTYPACRAVLAAKTMGKEEAMITALQEAYYLRALNPSDVETHLFLAKELGMDTEAFKETLFSSMTEEALQADFTLARSLHVQGFPSLVLEIGYQRFPIRVDYTDEGMMLERILLLS